MAWRDNGGAVGAQGQVVDLEEALSFDDSDHFDGDSLCSFMSEPESFCKNWRGWQTNNAAVANVGVASSYASGDKVQKGPKHRQVESLIELSAKTVAVHYPFEQVEKVYPPIPENLQLRITFWSFPNSEDDIRLYSCLANGNADEYFRGENLVKNNSVHDVMQIGFHLSGTVHYLPLQASLTKAEFRVAVTFDRQCITSCSCSCDSTARWCSHVVALCLARIQKPESLCLRAPVSESLSRLRRDQLRKFAQYLISELPQQILPTAQRLLDELLSSKTAAINKQSGAPDPTAGPSMSDINTWYLDEQALSENIKKTLGKFCGPTPIVFSDVNSLYLSSTEPPAASEFSNLLRPLRGREPEGIWNLLSIVREMLRRQDSNAILLLEVITDQCLMFEQIAVWWYNTCTSPSHLQSGTSGHTTQRAANNINSEIAQNAAATMCDELVLLWQTVVVDPTITRDKEVEIKSKLEVWHQKTLNIIKRGKYKEEHLALFPGFKVAIHAVQFMWDRGNGIRLLRHILCTCGNWGNNGDEGQPRVTTKLTAKSERNHDEQYRKELDILFSRSESLHVHGYKQQAREMAVKLAQELLGNSTKLNIPMDNYSQDTMSAWMKQCTEFACKTLDRVIFLCSVLSEYPSHHSLAFQIGLHGLQLERFPASSKSLEVKLFHKQYQLSQALKKLPLGAPEIALVAEKAKQLLSNELFTCKNPSNDVNANGKLYLFPLSLATFIFEAFCQPTEPASWSNRRSRDATFRMSEKSKLITNVEEDIAFKVAVTSLAFKVNVSEAEHPLLCEGTCRQKKELALNLLSLYKNDTNKIKQILNHLLDKSLATNLKATSYFVHERERNHSTITTTPITHVEPMKDEIRPTMTEPPMHHMCSMTSQPTNNDSVVGYYAPNCTTCQAQTNIILQQSVIAVQPQIDSVSSVSADESSDESDVKSCASTYKDTNDDQMLLHRSSLQVDSGNEDLKSSSCDDEPPTPIVVCSPQRRETKSWRSPTVRPKRRQHCVPNVNSSASEEAMLSDTSPRLPRKQLNSIPLLSSSSKNGTQAWLAQRQVSSPTSDNSSITSNKSEDDDTGDIPGPSTIAPMNSNNPITKNKNNFRSKNRGRNSSVVPDIPNHPSEAMAHFFFELAKGVLVKAGGNASTSLFMQPRNASQGGVNRNLLLAAFEIGLYALGMHNCVSPNWISRTYSSHVSWITGQAMEIGSSALQILVDSWEGHLTPPETASLADRASRGRDAQTVQVAAELALSVLPHAHALNPNEIQRALLQCREQGRHMLEKASIAVEQAGKGGGVYPEVLFEVARQWQWIHEQMHKDDEPPTTSANNIPTHAAQINQHLANMHCFNQLHINPVGNPALAVPASGMVFHPIFQSDPRHAGLPPPVPLIHQRQSTGAAPLLNQPTPFPTAPVNSGPVVTGSHPPIVTQHAAAYSPIHHHRAAVNLVAMPQPGHVHALHYAPSTCTFLPDTTVHHSSPTQLPQAPTQPPIAPISASPPIPLQNPSISYQLQSSFRVGMLALDLLVKRTEDRPTSKYVKNPPYANDVKWLLQLSLQLGLPYVQQFCLAAVTGISSPFILQDIAHETAQYLNSNQQQPCSHWRSPFLQPIVQKCLQMYMHFIHHRLYHVHPSEYDDFVNLVYSARTAFCMTPGGIIQFNEVLQNIHRAKACRKELWSKIVTGLSTAPNPV